MKKPLAIFVGAAVVALAVLIGLTSSRWQNWPNPLETLSKPESEAQIATKEPEAAPQPDTQQDQAAEQPQAEQPAAQQDTAEEPQKQVEATEQAPADQQAQTGEKGGTFDVVRIEENGEAVFAGRCDPHATVALLMDSNTIGSAKANELGEWLIVPDNPIPAGSHEFILESTNPNGRKWLSQQTLMVSVEADKKPLIVLSEPNQPSKVLQKPEEQVATAPETGQPSQQAQAEQPASGEQQAQAEQPATTPEAPAAQQPTAEASKSAEAGGEQASDAAKPAEQESGQASSETGQQVAQTETGESAGQTVAPETSQDVAKAPEMNLSMDTVDYNDRGDIIFSGKAKQGSTVRLYVDNQHVGDAVADAQGAWSFAGREEIVPGTHSLRADVVDAAGKVSQRIELPFQRADPNQVAVLQEERKTDEQKTSEPQAQEQKSAAAEQPEAQTSTRATEGVEDQSSEQSQETAEQPSSTQQQAAEGPKVAEPQAEAKQDAESDSGQQSAAQVPAEQPAPQPRKGRVVIQPGNNLWRIARVIYGQGVEYTTIYEANKELIRDPDLIYPGQIFSTPDVVPPEEIDPKRRKPLSPEEMGNR